MQLHAINTIPTSSSSLFPPATNEHFMYDPEVFLNILYKRKEKRVAFVRHEVRTHVA